MSTSTEPSRLDSEGTAPESTATEDVTLEDLARFARRANGFALAFVRVNVPIVRDRIVRELEEELAKNRTPRELRVLEPDGADLLEAIQELEPPFGPGQVLCVVGMESVIPGDPEQKAGALARLNRQREGFRQFPGPILLFLPEYALTRLAREAPDFWAWRSGVFEVVMRDVERTSILEDLGPIDDSAAMNSDMEAKRRTLAVVRGLLEEIDVSGRQGRAIDVAELLLRAANLEFFLGNWSRAERDLQAVVELCSTSGFQEVKASALAFWAIVLMEQGLLEESLHKVMEARRLYEAVGDVNGMAELTFLQGKVLVKLGRLEEALAAFAVSRELFEAVGKQDGVIRGVSGVATTLRLQGNHDGAWQLFEEILSMAEEKNDRAGAAEAGEQLSWLAHNRGDLGLAERLLTEALEQARHLGDAVRQGVLLHKLGSLLMERGDLEGAKDCFLESDRIAQKRGLWRLHAANTTIMGMLSVRRGSVIEAARFALALFDQLQQSPTKLRLGVALVQELRQGRDLLGPERFDEAVRELCVETPERGEALLEMLQDGTNPSDQRRPEPSEPVEVP